MTTKTAPRPQAKQPPAAPKSSNKRTTFVALALIAALVIGGVIGWAIWGGSNTGPTTMKGSYGTVKVQDAYVAKITFVNGSDGVGLRPLSGGRPIAVVYATVPGTIKPKVGKVVNAVIMTVVNPNGNGYQMATLWPKSAP